MSDPAARARYDDERRDYAELSEAEGRALATAEELARKGKEDEAIRVLEELLERQADAIEARLRLGSLLLDAERAKDALPQHERVVQLRPDHAPARVQLALTLARLDRHVDARRELGEAVRLQPGEINHRLFLAESCRVGGAGAEAERALDEAVPLAKDAFARLRILEQRIRLRTLRQRDNPTPASTRPVAPVLAEVVDIGLAGDPELRRFAADRLASIAARLFGTSEADRANELLRAAARLLPDDPLVRPLEPRITLGWDQVPPALMEWLRTRKRDGETAVNVASGAAIALLPALATALGVAAVLVFRRYVGTGHVAIDLLLVALFVASLVTAHRRGAELEPSDRPKPMYTAHPFWFVQVLTDRVVLWPWACLSAIRFARQGSNISMTLQFGPLAAAGRVWGQSHAQRWNALAAHLHQQVLDRMAHGALETVPEIDVAPPGALPSSSNLPTSRLERTVWQLAGVAVLLGMIGVADAARPDPRIDAAAADTPEALVTIDDPGASARVDRLEKRAEAHFRELVDETRPGAAAVLAAGTALAPGGTLPVRAENPDKTFFDEIAATFAVRGPWLHAERSDALEPSTAPAGLVAERHGETVHVALWVAGSKGYEADLAITPALSMAAVVTDALGLGHLPPATRRQLLGPVASPFGEAP